jgi:hypothetical protein
VTSLTGTRACPQPRTRPIRNTQTTTRAARRIVAKAIVNGTPASSSALRDTRLAARADVRGVEFRDRSHTK